MVCLALALGAGAIGLSQLTALSLALLITAVWWLVVTLPLLRRYRQVHYAAEGRDMRCVRALSASAIRCGICMRISRCSGFAGVLLLHRWRIHHH